MFCIYRFGKAVPQLTTLNGKETINSTVNFVDRWGHSWYTNNNTFSRAKSNEINKNDYNTCILPLFTKKKKNISHNRKILTFLAVYIQSQFSPKCSKFGINRSSRIFEKCLNSHLWLHLNLCWISCVLMPFLIAQRNVL